MGASLFRMGLAFVLAGSLGACQSTTPAANLTPGGGSPSGQAGVDRPGTTTRVNPPDINKWAGPQTRPNGALRYMCRPLACPVPSFVDARRGPSPTRDPDEQALRKIAREIIPANIEAEQVKLDASTQGHVRMKLLRSQVTKVRNYPAVMTEVERRGVGTPDHLVRVDMFVGATRVQFTSVSKSMAVSRANLDAFVQAMDIYDLAPAPLPTTGVTSQNQISPAPPAAPPPT